MTHRRLVSQRHGPGEHDNITPTIQSLEFDYSHAGGATPWPLRHGEVKWGPALVRRALASGLLVYAVVPDVPYPVLVKEARWDKAGTFQVSTLEKWAIPGRVFTRTTAKGLTSSGLLIEKESGK